jgi:outer membrane protein OmpA-like peptidoglycan-associated protein
MSPTADSEGASASVAKTDVVEALNQTILMGKVVDDANKQPLNATIRIEDLKNNQEVITCTTDPSTGLFITALPTSGSYRVVVRAKGYLYYATAHKRLGEDGQSVLQMLAAIKQIIPDQTLVLKNVFFERASPKLQIESHEELNHLVQTLQENPDLVIEIGGHTDNLGNPARLQKLSELRMQSVRQYLIDRGIDGKRLEGKGYGGTKPIADNTIEEERAKNRRVEFKVLKVK